jgi:hypothetical protein
MPQPANGAFLMTDNIATLRGFTRTILADSDEVSLHLLIRPDTDLDSTVRAWDTDEQQWIKVNGWLFTIEDIEQTKRPMPSDYRPYDQFPEFSEGIDDYMSGKFENPYTDPRDGVKAQAWARGAEYTSRVIRHDNR